MHLLQVIDLPESSQNFQITFSHIFLFWLILVPLRHFGKYNRKNVENCSILCSEDQARCAELLQYMAHTEKFRSTECWKVLLCCGSWEAAHTPADSISIDCGLSFASSPSKSWGAQIMDIKFFKTWWLKNYMQYSCIFDIRVLSVLQFAFREVHTKATLLTSPPRLEQLRIWHYTLLLTFRFAVRSMALLQRAGTFIDVDVVQ